jgi:hypothetical protein
MQRIIDQDGSLVGLYDTERKEALLIADHLEHWDIIKAELPPYATLNPGYYGLDHIARMVEVMHISPVFYRVSI